MSQFVMPSLGADMESAVLMEWHVKEGDTVHKGDVIAEVETSKGVIEIEVFEDGIIEKLLVQEETDCAVGTPLAIIRTANEAQSEQQGNATGIIPSSEPKAPAPLSPEPVTASATAAGRIKASPAARRKAKELGIELSALSSAEGGIHLSDIETSPPKSAEPVPLSGGMRQAIAKAMSRSNAEIPHYYLTERINMTPALNWLAEENKKRSIKDRILPAALLIRAVVRSLQDVPQLNGFWRENAPEISEAIHPGIAIALRKEGLITPAILDAQTMNLEETMHALDDLITRTRSGKLRNTEITQQTVTITNLGDLGVESVYGVIYPPQIALIGLGKIVDAPWAEGDALCVRKVMQATLAGDHRATDGRTGALFLDTFNRYLQNPQELL